MRLCVRLWNETEQRLPLSHLDLLCDALSGAGEPTMLPVSLSDLRVPSRHRRIDAATGELVIAPGKLLWWLASPDDDFLTRLAVRFAPGQPFAVGDAIFRHSDTVPHFFPRLQAGTAPVSLRFSCRTPIVASRTADAYETIIRQSLLDAFARVYNRVPATDTVGFAFDAAYLQSHPRGGRKRIEWRGESVDGILAPFTLSASPELLQVAWECGVGERTADGFGFAEIADA